MNQFYFGTMNQYIETGYAPTGRAKCKNCKQQIQNNSLRIGILMDDDHFSGKYWYHLPCFQLKPRFKDMDPEQQIYNIDHLEPQDYDSVLAHVKDELKRLKQGKKPSKTVRKPQPTSKRLKSQSKSKKDQSESEKQVKLKKGKSKSKKEQSESQSQSQVKPKKGKSKATGKREVKKAEKSSVKSDKSASKSVSKSVKSKASQKKGKKKVAKKEKPKQGYTEVQKQQYKELYDKYMGMSADALKNILAANSQSRTGNKSDLAQKCADGKILGKIPMCSSCGGGRLRFDRKTGIYSCPGYMDDDVFRNCGKKLTLEEVVRQPWTQP